MNFVPPLGANKSLRLDQVVKRLRLASGCKLILDAADVRSYASGQTWLDRSGGGHDFYRGTTSGSEASDPTFNGNAGTLGAYWFSDGGDVFTYDSTNEAWMENIHKDNAIFTFICWAYFAAAATTSGMVGTRGASGTGQSGFRFLKDAADKLALAVFNGTTAQVNVSTAAAVGLNGWHMLSASLNETTGTNGLFLGIDAAFELFTSTYASPSSGAAGFTMQVGAIGNAIQPMSSGARMGGFMGWEGVALTQAQVTAIYQATRRRYGV